MVEPSTESQSIPPLLTEAERSQWLAENRRWRLDPERNALHRSLRLADFAEALALMVRIGVHAERLNHHPEWTNVYDRLEIWLTTHDAGGVTRRDLILADIIEGMVEPMGGRKG